jgi:hypothetical protein
MLYCSCCWERVIFVSRNTAACGCHARDLGRRLVPAHSVSEALDFKHADTTQNITFKIQQCGRSGASLIS